jgi:hypothetical protein
MFAFVGKCTSFEPINKLLLLRVYYYKVFRLKSCVSGTKSAKFCISVFVSGLRAHWFKALLLIEKFSSNIISLADKKI